MRRTPSSPVILAPPVYFVSDAHLGAVRGEPGQIQHRLLHELLEEVGARGRTMVIAGDLFDFWFEWKHVIPKQHFPVLFDLKGLVDRGISIHYLAGNHDFRLHGFLEEAVGLSVHGESLSTRIANESVFIYHGDGVLASDHGYRLLKKVLRNRLAQKSFSWIHPDWSWRLARGTSYTSRSLQSGRDDDDTDYLAFAQRKFGEGFTGVVMGHTHRPVEHHEDGCTYLNLGDWIEHFTYGLHDGTKLSLEHWRGSNVPRSPERIAS